MIICCLVQDATAQKKNANRALQSAEEAFQFFKVLETDANETLVTLGQLREKVDLQTGRIKVASQKANDSQHIAEDVGREAVELLGKVEDMSKLLKANGSLNISLLAWIETQLDSLDASLRDFQLDNILRAFEQKNATQQEEISKYVRRIDGLQARVVELENNNASIPAPPACFNSEDPGGD